MAQESTLLAPELGVSNSALVLQILPNPAMHASMVEQMASKQHPLLAAKPTWAAGGRLETIKVVSQLFGY